MVVDFRGSAIATSAEHILVAELDRKTVANSHARSGSKLEIESVEALEVEQPTYAAGLRVGFKSNRRQSSRAVRIGQEDRISIEATLNIDTEHFVETEQLHLGEDLGNVDALDDGLGALCDHDAGKIGQWHDDARGELCSNDRNPAVEAFPIFDHDAPADAHLVLHGGHRDRELVYGTQPQDGERGFEVTGRPTR